MNGQPKKFWIFNELSEAQAELFLFGVLSNETWWGDEITPKLFADDLKALESVKEIIVRINSPGGDVFAAIAISGMLRDSPARIIAQVDGLCASAATLVMANADHVRVSPESMIMIHDPMSYASGTAEDMDKAAAFLRKAKESILDVYERRTGIDRAELSRMMADETWMNGAEAVNLKFADELTENVAGAAARFTAASWSMAELRASVAAKMKKPEVIDYQKLDAEKAAVELELLRLF